MATATHKLATWQLSPIHDGMQVCRHLEDPQWQLSPPIDGMNVSHHLEGPHGVEAEGTEPALCGRSGGRSSVGTSACQGGIVCRVCFRVQQRRCAPQAAGCPAAGGRASGQVAALRPASGPAGQGRSGGSELLRQAASATRTNAHVAATRRRHAHAHIGISPLPKALTQQYSGGDKKSSNMGPLRGWR